MDQLPDVDRICGFHTIALSNPDWPDLEVEQGDRPADVMYWVALNHRCNGLLWQQEDQARRRDLNDAYIVACKRAIDHYNQKRNDAIEALDRCILDQIVVAEKRPGYWLNSETAGSIVDRLSILSLKIHYMGLAARRPDTSVAHRRNCAHKLDLMRDQRQDLRACLAALLDGIQDGRCGFKVYRQFKMYNDPALNPWLASAQGLEQD